MQEDKFRFLPSVQIHEILGLDDRGEYLIGVYHDNDKDEIVLLTGEFTRLTLGRRWFDSTNAVLEEAALTEWGRVLKLGDFEIGSEVIFQRY